MGMYRQCNSFLQVCLIVIVSFKAQMGMEQIKHTYQGNEIQQLYYKRVHLQR